MKSGDNNLSLPNDPLDGFLKWLNEAETAGLPEPTAMTLATATRQGRPSARIVLFKGLSLAANDSHEGRSGLRFFTNYTSRKSEELFENPQAALCFHWVSLARQIRFEGRVEKLSVEESDAYFQSRPRGSRIGAWASPQSRKIEDRQTLDRLVDQAEERFSGQDVPLPPHWGGWRLVPEVIEFWQGVDRRLHDRFIFEWSGTEWQSSRLAP